MIEIDTTGSFKRFLNINYSENYCKLARFYSFSDERFSILLKQILRRLGRPKLIKKKHRFLVLADIYQRFYNT